MFKKALVGSAVLALMSSTAFAGGEMEYHKEEREKTKYKKVVIEIEEEEEAESYLEILAFGGAATMDIDSPLIDVTSSETDSLNQTNKNDLESWTAQLGLGYSMPLFDAEEWSDEVQWFTAIEPQINVYFLDGRAKGDVYAFEMEQFDLSDFSSRIESTRLMFDAGLDVAKWRNITVYGIAGLGVSWNRIDYTATPNAEGIQADWGTVSTGHHTSTNFAWEAGGGATVDVLENVGVSLQYLFTGISDLEYQGNDIESTDFNLHSQAIMLGVRVAI